MTKISLEDIKECLVPIDKTHKHWALSIIDQNGDKTLAKFGGAFDRPFATADIDSVIKSLDVLSAFKKDCSFVVLIITEQKEKAFKALNLVKEANDLYENKCALNEIERNKPYFVDFFWHFLKDNKQEAFADKTLKNYGIIASRDVDVLEKNKPIDLIVQNTFETIQCC